MGSWRSTRFYGLDETLTDEQKVFLDAIEGKRVIIANARSGTGKTTLATGMAKLSGKDLLYIFNPTEEDKTGFRPGTQEEKESQYLQPLKDALIKIGENPLQVIRPQELDKQKAGNYWVEAKSHIFVRGTNIVDKFVIIDEAQNFTVHDLKKVLTRIHDDCTVVIIGHHLQCDLKDPRKSGFTHLIEHFKSKKYVAVVELTKNFRGELSRDADDM